MGSYIYMEDLGRQMRLCHVLWHFWVAWADDCLNTAEAVLAQTPGHEIVEVTTSKLLLASVAGLAGLEGAD